MTADILQHCDPYFRQIPYNISEQTRQELLEIALAPDAFVDISFKISFFKLPSTLQRFNKTGLDCVCQMLKVTESGSKIHKDKSRHNEYEGIYIPRNTIINYPLTPNPGETYFYDENENFVCKAIYENNGAILNTSDFYHNVNYIDNGTPRIVFQLCFEEKYGKVCQLYEDYIEGILL